MEKANAEFPPFPEYTAPTPAPVHTAFFFTAPGSVYWATKSGTWGDAAASTPEMGERYLAGRRALDARRAREHREDVHGDAAALTMESLRRGGLMRRESGESERRIAALRAIVLAAALLLPAAAAAQPTRKPADSALQRAEASAVLAPINGLFAAFEAGDAAAMLRHVYPDGRVTASGCASGRCVEHSPADLDGVRRPRSTRPRLQRAHLGSSHRYRRRYRDGLGALRRACRRQGQQLRGRSFRSCPREWHVEGDEPDLLVAHHRLSAPVDGPSRSQPTT